MNKKDKYFGDSRYEKVWEQMKMLSIQDVSTSRQDKNGTIVWKLPIKCGINRFIEVASFKTGYVRNQNGGYTNYQLNKRVFVDDYYPEYKTVDGEYKKTGKYNKYQLKSCVLIPIEINRLEYLIAYCLKNYYIKNANQVVDGKYVSKWYHEYELKRQDSQSDRGHCDRIQDLEVEVELLQEQQRKNEKTYYSPREVIVTVDGHRYKVQ